MFMVERYLPGVGCRALREALRRTAEVAAALSEEGVQVRYLGSTFVPDEEVCFCRFEARDAEAVRHVNERAALPFWRVVPAQFVDACSPEGGRDERP